LTGKAQTSYVLRIPQYSHPIFIRGGRSSDALALYEVLVTKEYELTADLDPPAFIIDGGANIGMASIYFLNRYPATRVLAVEPSPDNFDILRKNLAPYADRVTLIQGAIWKCDGHVSLQIGQQEWLSRVREDQSGSIEAFTMRSLIGFGNGKVDVLKLDIEGGESEVFGPEAQEWLPGVRNIAIELHGDDRKARFFDALTEYRYDLCLQRTWTDSAPGSSMSCYLAICQNLRLKSLG
jgi:FkbM family methyltransferase